MISIFSPTRGDETPRRRCERMFVYSGAEASGDGLMLCDDCRSGLWVGRKR